MVVIIAKSPATASPSLAVCVYRSDVNFITVNLNFSVHRHTGLHLGEKLLDDCHKEYIKQVCNEHVRILSRNIPNELPITAPICPL